MGVFDYLSSLWDKDKPTEPATQPAPAKPQPARTAPAPPAAKKEAKSQQPQGKNRSQSRQAQRNESKPAAVRPEAPVAAPPVAAQQPHVEPRAAEPAVAETFPEVTPVEADRALDEVFGDGASRNVTHVSAIAKELDEASVRELFGGIAANQARPIKNFIFELKRGTATKEWIEVCRPVMATLVEAAGAMDLCEAARTMAEFDEALALAQSDGSSSKIEDAAKDLLLSAFHEMATSLPEAFQVGEDERRRDAIIIHSLLKQVPDVGHVTFERLYGAGLTSLEALILANSGDLSAATGIPGWLCDRLCERIQIHRRELERAQRASGQGERREQLRKLVEELHQRHEGFERVVAEDWSDPALSEEKREYRQGRQMCALQIEVVLAEMGELDLVEQIQKLSFARRIEKLREFIDSSANAVPAGVLAGAGAERSAARPAER